MTLRNSRRPIRVPFLMSAPLRFYHPRIIATLLGLFLCGSLVAENLVPLKLRYHRITLSNGRVLKDVTLNGLNRESNLIYVLEDNRLKPYPSVLFPSFVNEAIERHSAEYPDSPPPSAPDPTSEKSLAIEPSSPAPIGSPESHAANRRAVNAALTTKAEKAALNHLRYRIRMGSGYVTVTDAAVELAPPQQVPGWPNRFRIKGDGYYSYYESVGGAFQRRARSLEITLEAPSPDSIKIISIDTLWGHD
jgi:hypothetical protein